MDLITSLLQAAVRMAAPLTFTAVGETYNERAGTLNIGLEGLMLIGALTAYLFAFFYQSIAFGVLMAALVAGVFGLLFAILTISLRANQIIVGTALNLVGLGVTSYVHRSLFSQFVGFRSITSLKPVEIPILSQIPIIGPAFFQQNLLVYGLFILVPLSAFILNKTALGLAIRAAGEHPKAVATAGLSVIRIRYGAAIFGAMMAGIGGAFLTVAHANIFVENMVAGRGFIALAIVVFAQWRPNRVILAGILFGFAYALQLRLQIADIKVPYQLIQILPYVATILAMIVWRGQTAQPKALAVPYTEQT
jgi:general nucleoside transport system permease protein